MTGYGIGEPRLEIVFEDRPPTLVTCNFVAEAIGGVPDLLTVGYCTAPQVVGAGAAEPEIFRRDPKSWVANNVLVTRLSYNSPLMMVLDFLRQAAEHPDLYIQSLTAATGLVGLASKWEEWRKNRAAAAKERLARELLKRELQSRQVPGYQPADDELDRAARSLADVERINRVSP